MAELKPKVVALSEVSPQEGLEKFEFLLLPEERIEKAYRSIRDRLIVTNRRLIVVDIQGLLGKKIEYMVIPYSKVSAFSVETAGTFDLDGELKLWLSGLGEIEFQFIKQTKVSELAKLLSARIG